MTARRGGLGRGLGALIPGSPSTGGEPGPAHLREIGLDDIRPNPRQPRRVFDDYELGELAWSIREVGLLQPVVVRPADDGGYELVVGERRWRAARLAGLVAIPALVRQTADDDLLRDALLENLHRAQLNPLEEAAAYGQLLEDFGATHEQLAERLGRSRSHVTNTLRLLQLPPPVQRRVAAGVLSAGHARALLALDDRDAQESLANRIVAEGLSVRSTEEVVATRGDDSPSRRSGRSAAGAMRTPVLDEVAGALSELLETRVRAELGRTKGRLTVEFASVDDLERILRLVAPSVASRLPSVVTTTAEGDPTPAEVSDPGGE